MVLITKVVDGPIKDCLCNGCRAGLAQMANGATRAGGYCLACHLPNNGCGPGLMFEMLENGKITHSNGWCLVHLQQHIHSS